jgi:hypothetical protein
MAMQLQRVAGELRHDETKTDDSTRVVALPRPCVGALRRHRAQHAADRLTAGDRWTESGLVFTTRKGTPLEPQNINRTFDALVKRAGVKRIRFLISDTPVPRCCSPRASISKQSRISSDTAQSA